MRCNENPYMGRRHNHYVFYTLKDRHDPTENLQRSVSLTIFKSRGFFFSISTYIIHFLTV